MCLQKPYDSRCIINCALTKSFLLGKVGMYPLFYASQCKGLCVALLTHQKPTPLHLDYGIFHIINVKLLKNLVFEIISYFPSICCLFRKARSEIIIVNPVSNKVPEFLGIHSKEEDETTGDYETA